jgi:hypothetical protein
MNTTSKQAALTPCEGKKMKTIFRKMLTGAALFAALSLGSFAQADDGPPAFTFEERCVPYEVDPDFMRANGVDPNKIISAFVAGGDGIGFPGDVPGTGNNGSNAPWRGDYTGGYDFFGNPIGTAVPCGDFHTNKRRTRYEGCHFYDGTPCYFVTTGQMDPQGFTPDAAGRRAFEIAEHFVLYEFTQEFGEVSPPSTFWPGGYSPPPLFTDPYAGGFAVGSQTKIFNAKGSYFTDNPIGLWKQGLVNFTVKAAACRSDLSGTDPDCVFLHNMVAANGQASQNIGYPLVYTGDELFGLLERDLASLRYRLGNGGVGGAQDTARYILCPTHEAPNNGDISPGNDIIQPFPAHIEWQPPSAFFVINLPPFSRGSHTIAVFNPFGPTPPVGTGPFAEHLIVDNFHCLQQTGNFCP